jgi:hypothetical protein
VTYQFVCKPCLLTLGLPAERAYLNRIRRETGGFSKSGTAPKAPLIVVSRDNSGKPILVGEQQKHAFVSTLTSCSCACSENGHDPLQCSGDGKFSVGGRPGSGSVDELAEKFGREPTPELAVAPQEVCQALVRSFLAWWFGSSDEERIKLESNDLARMRYEDQIRLLRDILQEDRAELMSQQPYCDLITNLKNMVQFRDIIAHSWPADGDFFTRIKRVNAKNIVIHITPEELAEYLDLSEALQSQLSFLPVYWH